MMKPQAKARKPLRLQLKQQRKSKIPFISKMLRDKKKRTALLTGMMGVMIGAVSVMLSETPGLEQLKTVGIIGGALVAVVPTMMFNMSANRRKESIDRNMPIFLLALVGAVQSGLSILRALEEAADRNMGMLTPELKNLRANISWGMPIDRAFDQFIKRLGTTLSRRIAILLQIAVQSGGEVVNTLELIQKHVTEMMNIEKERKASLAPYVYTIYISFVVFLAVAILISANFFTEVEKVQQQLIASSKQSGVSLTMFQALLGVKVSDLNQIMFNMSIVEAVFGGIAAGKIAEGSFVAGIKHVIVMVVLGVMAWVFMAPGGGGI